MVSVGCTIQRIEREMWHIFVYTLCLSHIWFDFLFRPCNCTHWLKYQQSWANHCFRIDALVHLDTISLIDVYQLTIHAAIQQKESPPYLYYQTHILWQTRNTVNKNFQNGNNTLKTTDICHICALVIFIRTYIFRKLEGVKMTNGGIQSLSLALRTKL